MLVAQEAAVAAVVLDRLTFTWPDGTVALTDVTGAFGTGRTGLIGRNGSGTDHGNASASLLIGAGVAGGLKGAMPSLTSLTSAAAAGPPEVVVLGDARSPADFVGAVNAGADAALVL